MSTAWEKYQQIRPEINVLAQSSGKNTDSVQIVAVTKTVPAKNVFSFLESADSKVILGENYVQEFLRKIQYLPDGFESHLIGPLQSNKIKLAVGQFDVIESVHNFKTFNAIARQAVKLGIVQNVFLQVNISEDPAKQGFKSNELINTFDVLSREPGIRILGLMTITMNYTEPEQARPDFIAMRELRDRLNPALKLSMGMSADYKIAVAEGADYVRIGTAIFGERV